MSPLTINAAPLPILRGGWEITPSYAGEETSEGVDGSVRSGVTAAREHDRRARYESPPMDRAEAEALIATLEGGPVALGGWAPRGDVTAVAHQVQAVEFPDPLKLGVRCEFWFDL